jgi:hypothetical protein
MTAGYRFWLPDVAADFGTKPSRTRRRAAGRLAYRPPRASFGHINPDWQSIRHRDEPAAGQRRGTATSRQTHASGSSRTVDHNPRARHYTQSRPAVGGGRADGQAPATTKSASRAISILHQIRRIRTLSQSDLYLTCKALPLFQGQCSRPIAVVNASGLNRPLHQRAHDLRRTRCEGCLRKSQGLE